MTQEAYSDFYRSVYRPLVSAFHGRLINHETIQKEQGEYAHYVAGVLQRFGHGVGEWKTLLDIGGSTGVVATHLSQTFGGAATIIDPAPDEIAEAAKIGVETITGFIEHWPSNGRRFDLIGMFQTVDHLLDVAVTLKKVGELLQDGGVFIMDIVDFRAAYLRTRSIERATKIDHPFSLTQLTAEAYLRRAGFAIAGKSFSPDHLHVLYLCTKAPPDASALPTPSQVASYFDEIRYVQNTVGVQSE
jgi:ubiquinone/menaquinone biosynthesis C-methylase UbiE